MIKDMLFYLVLVGLIFGAHYGLSASSGAILFNNTSILSYVVLIILSVISSSVFLLEKKVKDLLFPQAFLIVTVVQMLGAMSFAAYLRYTLDANIRNLVLQFVVIFLLYLIVQSVYLIKTKARS